MALAGRNGTIDLLRGMAALGIVWFHAGAPLANVAYSGLTVFFLLLVLFCPGPDAPLGRLVAGRADRLIRPWLVWSAIFALAKILQALLAQRPLSDEFALWMVLTGPGLHLWFLPFGFVCLVGLGALERLVDLRSGPAFAVILLLCLVAMPVGGWVASPTTGHPWAEWAAAIAPVVIGVGLRAAGGSVLRQGLVMAVTLLSFGVTRDAPFVVPLGLALTLAALHLRLPPHPVLTAIGAAAMPIYLCHPIFLSLLGATQLSQVPAILALLVTGLAALMGAAIQRLGLAPRFL